MKMCRHAERYAKAKDCAPPPSRAPDLKPHKSHHRSGQNEAQPDPPKPAAELVKLLHPARQPLDVPAQSLQVRLLFCMHQAVKTYWIRKK